ncbi:hypothetical protein DL95DRAFT_384039 [Leptodontidium sp. 2 PMI_412]|nr:hypothetical protein DL95DRAFT_384039 [Leptodontidium sp. 2 PMI_412]
MYRWWRSTSQPWKLGIMTVNNIPKRKMGWDAWEARRGEKEFGSTNPHHSLVGR